MKAIIFILLCFYALASYSSNVEVSAQVYNRHGDSFLAITFDHSEHWHTYWKNPGDAGTPPEVKFSINGKQHVLSELEWPAPQEMKQEGNLLAYGYENRNAIFYYLSPKDLEIFSKSTVQFDINWLACKDICVPESTSFTGTLKNNLLEINNPNKRAFNSSELDRIFSTIPASSSIPANLEIYLTVDPGKNDLILHYTFSGVDKVNLPHKLGLLTPFPQLPFSFQREKLYFKDNNLYGIIDIKWEGEFEEPPIALPTNGSCERPWILKFLIQNPITGKVEIIKKKIEHFQTKGIETKKAYYQSLAPHQLNQDRNVKQHLSTKKKTPVKQPSSIWIYLLFAFIGGLILNIMPCVLPVISIKLFGLIKHSNQSKAEILKHNLFYSLGIFLSFLVLALSVHLLKMTGEEVGWGFQLQSPLFVALMIVALFVFAINLFGLFEFSTPGGNKLGGLQLKDNYTGDLLSGVLATILSTPCSAPFLGTALTFAFTTSTATLYMIFLMIGLGLAFPFILTGFFPKALAILPRPGMWMEHLKKFLGLSLLLTMIWLVDVFIALSSTDALFALNLLLTMTFFTLFLWHKITKKIIYRAIFILLTILSAVLFYNSLNSSSSKATIEGGTTQTIHQLNWEKWTPEKMATPTQLTFVDFTAKWCFTCKANERLVINTEQFRSLIKKYNVKLLLADWTKRDAIIGNWLKQHGYAGVPVYFVVSASGKLISLGETISIDKIEQALKSTGE